MNIKSIIVAAGRGSRFGCKKQFEMINGKMVLDFSVNILKGFGDVIIVVPESDIEFVRNRYLDLNVVGGGKERMHSVFNGLKAIDKCDIVLIHDAARPLVEKANVERLIEVATDYQAAILAARVFDTLKLVESGFSLSTLDREKVFISQTPHAFNYKKLFVAMERAIQAHKVFTDEAALWEMVYGGVKIVEGSRKNIKITTREDLEIVRCLLG